MLRLKIENFLFRANGKSYSAKSLSKVLHINHETARKYLREGVYMGSFRRFKDKKTGFRYYV